MNQLAYDGRVRAAARYFQKSPSLAGLACGCQSRALRGYITTTLRGLAAPSAKVPVLIPISDTKAVAAAVRMFQPKALRGLGDTQQVQGAAALASTGAKVGTIWPGVGTVIGAVVGAVVGWVSGSKPPVRPSKDQVAQCQAMLTEYMGYAAQLPNTPIPMDVEQLRQLNWCLDAVHGAKIQLRDPRWFDPDVSGVFIPMAKDVVKKIYETPVGQTVNLGAISFKDPKGRTINFSGYSFINPQFTDIKTFCDSVFVPMSVKMCQETAGKGSGGCESYYGQTLEFRRWLYDLLAWAARTVLPNISEEDLKAASAVAKNVGASAKDVVTAVEQIIGKNVASGETAKLLSTTAVTVPPPSTAPPPGPMTSAPPAPIIGGSLSPTTLPPASSSPDLLSLISQLIPKASTTLPTVNTLAPISNALLPATVPDVAPVASTANAWYQNPYVLAGGGAALLLFLFLKRRRRRT